MLRWHSLGMIVFGLLTAGTQRNVNEIRLPEIRLCFVQQQCITVEVAATPRARQRGLMFRESLPSHRGMLFVFPRDDFWTFWMKNTRFPLDMIWIGSDRTIVYMIPHVPPCRADPCPTYTPLKKARYVLEVPAGSIGKWNLRVGQKVRFRWPPRETDA